MGSKTPAGQQQRSHLYLHPSNIQAGLDAEWKVVDHTSKVTFGQAIPNVHAPPPEAELGGEKTTQIGGSKSNSTL